MRLAAGEPGELVLALDCDVADARVCADVLDALGDRERDRDAGRSCAPTTDRTGTRILVSGLIEGREVLAGVGRATDCDLEAYERIIRALAGA